MVTLISTRTRKALSHGITEHEAIKALIRKSIAQDRREGKKASKWDNARFIHAMILKGRIDTIEE